MIKYINLVLSFFCLFTCNLCFRETGHLIISRICEKKLYPDVLENIKYLLSFFTNNTFEENEYMFIESSLLADHLDEIEIESFKTWHFQDFMYDKGLDNKFDVKKESNKRGSTLWALNTLLKSLTSSRESVLDNRVFKSLNLRLFIHIIQDIHQPLHTTSTKFTNPVIEPLVGGDTGGNKFVFKFDPLTDGKYPQENQFVNEKAQDKLGYRLHKFIDYLLFEYRDITLPLNEQTFEYIDTSAQEIIDKFEKNKKKSNIYIGDTYNFLNWVLEGVELCKTQVYEGLTYMQDKPPSKDYIKRMKHIMDIQLYKAGVRLANVLNDLYKTDKYIKENPTKIPGNIKVEDLL